MIEILIPTLVGLLCFVIVLIGTTSNRNKLILSNYFLIILLLVGGVRILPFLYFIIDSSEPKYGYLMIFSIVATFFITPLFYIYLYSLISTIPSKWHYHMIVPVLIIVLISTVDFLPKPYFGLLISIYYLLYLVFAIILVIKFLSETPKNLFKLALVKNVKNWIIILIVTYTVTFIILIRSIVQFIFSNGSYNFAETFVLSSLVWSIILVYLITNRNLFLNSFQTKSIKESHLNFWGLNPLHKVDSKDFFLYNKLRPEEMIQKIIALEGSSTIVSKNQMSLAYISKKLNIPMYQLKLLFKYHNSLSVVEYQNVLKVIKAIHYIQDGYLNSFTIESLSNKIGFNSRITFYKNFKKYVGRSVTDYKNYL